MRVKNLVEFFDPPSTTIEASGSSPTGRRRQTLSSSVPSTKRPPSHTRVKISSRPVTTPTIPRAFDHGSSHDIAGAEDSFPCVRPRGGRSVKCDDASISLLSCGSSSNPPGGHRPETPPDATQLPSPPAAESHQLSKHIPVPATVVFARRAPPLDLPRLDKYLSSIPPPDFNDMRRSLSTMFSPMDKLSESGKSLDDLETNASRSPPWVNRNTILGSIVSIVLGVTGSSALASFYSLQGLFNTVQIFALILSTIVPVGGRNIQDKWRKIFLGTIPNILALNFASTLVQSLLYLLVFMAITAGLLYYFYRSSRRCDRYGVAEGFQQAGPRGKQWTLVIVTFLLTIIYLPLSTMAIHVLVWSEDLWIVPNPYSNATSYPPTLPPFGPTSEYRDPLDFCWTTTMQKNEVNYAPPFIMISAIVFLTLAVCYPIALHRAIKRAVPIVDKFTELGRARNSVEMDEEYHRLLTRDRNSFTFLYTGFRRGWGTYESIYLVAKLSTLLIIAVIDPNNCLFRSFPRSQVSVVRQVLLLISTIAFFGAQCIHAPFLDPVNNASEWVSRLNYVATSAVALAVVLNIPGKEVLNTYILYSIYAITYGFTAYFTLINLAFMQRAVKRLTRRIDFSIDIFSPRLDLSSSSPHTKRRIWQECISTLILISPECAIPKTQPMAYAQARDSAFPPYLLDFCGTPGERHVENMKILREVGTFAYNKAVALLSGPDHARYGRIALDIQMNFIGPDCYWKGESGHSDLSCSGYFGNAWWIPFPPTLVMRYDDGPLVILRELSAFENYIRQNSSKYIQRKRQVRLLLRALENQVVTWPYDHLVSIGEPISGWFGRKRYTATKSVHHRSCVLRIIRQGELSWNNLQLGSGFTVELVYGKHLTLTGDAIGLNDEFELTSPLANFFSLNETLIPSRLKEVEGTLLGYRRHHRKVCQWKNRVLTYGFLSKVYDQPRVIDVSTANESDPRVRQLIANNEVILKGSYERFKIVSRSETTAWWYLFWDDLWRRNYDTIPGLQRHAKDFNPHYSTSITYAPLPRAALEAFLIQRGLLSKTGRSNTFFTSGFLNKLYVRLNDTVFRSAGPAILFHIGDGGTEREMIEVDLETRVGQQSTIGTGGGTDHDNSWIQTRPNYRWEGMLGDPLRKGKHGRRHLLAKLGAWLGLTPTWRSGTPSSGLALDVRLHNGRYVVIDGQK